MNFKIIFLFFSLIIAIECYIKIPFTYFPSTLNKDDKPKNIMSSILDLKMFGLLEIGTPKQKCHIPINFGSNTFFLPEKSSFHYDIKYNISLYDNKNSSSFSIIKDEEEYEGENFLDAYYVNDVLYFGENKINLDFYLTTSYTFPQLGGLGLQLYPSSIENTATPDIEKTFMRKIKTKGLANNYIWSVFYETQKIETGEINGYILLGDYPHLSINFPDNSKYNFSLNYIDAEVYNKKIVETKFIMHKTEVIKDNKILMNINENFYVNLNYNFQGIKVPEKIGIYLEKNIFNSLDFCHKDKVSLITTNIFYYCDNHKDKINQLKKIFPIIKLENKILNSTFTINIDNLLYIKGNHVYILLIFEENDNNDWNLGIPFLQQYQFSINQDSKKIYYYQKKELPQKNEKREDNNIYNILIIVLSVFLFLLGLIIGILICYKNTRKKRKNELDENYDYMVNDGENNAIIN